MTKSDQIDIAELRQLWEADWLASDLASRYGCTETMIYWLKRRHGFADRERSQCKEPQAPSPEDAEASNGSLALSPWVAARAEEFRKQKEARGESLRGGVYLKTYSLRTLQAVE
jgi:hypothetical protein